MTPEDKDDIIKKINNAGENAGGDGGDDFGDTIDGEENNNDNSGDNAFDEFEDALGDSDTTDENYVAENGIEILPKEHKQVFKNAKLGVDENISENIADRIEIIKHSEEVETPVKPKEKPMTIPNRREKPWKVPVIKPQPKATK